MLSRWFLPADPGAAGAATGCGDGGLHAAACLRPYQLNSGCNSRVQGAKSKQRKCHICTTHIYK